MEASGQLHTQADFAPREEDPLYPLNGWLGPGVGPDQVAKSRTSAFTGSWTTVLQPMTS
jgi:hypothetical protein